MAVGREQHGIEEARWQGVLDTIRDALISIDRTGRVVLFNVAAEQIFGYSAKEVVGENVNVLMPSPYREAHDGYIRSYQTTGVPKAIGRIREVEGRRKNGEVFPIELSVSEARVGKELLYTAIIRDVTDRRQSDVALRRERDFAEKLLDTAAAIILVLDPEGRILQFNRFFEELTGWTLAEMEGRDWFDAFLPESDRESIRITFAAAVRGEAIRGTVSPILTRSHGERWIEWHATVLRGEAGEVVGVLSIGSDRTAHRETELREKELAAIVESSEDAIIGTALDDRITSWNRGAESVYGWTKEEAIGRLYAFLVPPELEGERRRLVERILSGERVAHVETERLAKGGGRVWVSLSLSAVEGVGGDVGGLSSIERDVTERRRAAAELDEVRAIARERERLADLGAISAQMVHEIGNPLTGISLQAQLVQKRAARDPRQTLETVLAPLDRITGEVRRLEALVRDFLNFARAHRIEKARVLVVGFLSEIADFWRPIAEEHGITFEVDVEAELLELWADPDSLRRVFHNLVKNAVEAIDRGPGRVRLVAAALAEQRVRISVEDTGPGLPEGLRLFRLFETTKPGGTGLGLAIAKQIVEAHSGTIEARNGTRRGSVVEIDLPRGEPRS